MLDPVVSVIIPTFNRAAVLNRSVESVIAQTWRPIQLIVVNDGSRDETRAVMDGLEVEADKSGVKTTFIHQANEGVSAARNAGMEAAKGEYIGFLDDDDEWLPHKLVKQVARIRETGTDACSCRTLRLSADGKYMHPREDKGLIEGYNPADFIAGRTYAHITSVLVSADKAREVGPFRDELVLGQDVEWLGRLVHAAKFCAVDEVLGRIYHDDDSRSLVESGQAMLEHDYYQMLTFDLHRRQHRDHEAWNEEAWRRRVARNYEQFVKHQLYAGNLEKAARICRKGINLAGPREELRKARRKLRKARWLALFGLRVKHPKFDRFEDIRM